MTEGAEGEGFDISVLFLLIPKTTSDFEKSVVRNVFKKCQKQHTFFILIGVILIGVID
jgi:hypothetical protein